MRLMVRKIRYPLKVVLVVYNRIRVLIFGLNKKIQNLFNKKVSSLFYYDVMIFELELDFARFFVVGVHNFSYSV